MHVYDYAIQFSGGLRLLVDLGSSGLRGQTLSAAHLPKVHKYPTNMTTRHLAYRVVSCGQHHSNMATQS